jgi:hypothetical protein
MDRLVSRMLLLSDIPLGVPVISTKLGVARRDLPS